MKAFLAVCLTALVAASSAAAARSAASPAGYRAKLNGICRSNTVGFHVLEKRMRHALQTNDTVTLRAAFIAALDLDIDESVVMLREPVPRVWRTRMAPALLLLKRDEALMRDMLVALNSGNGSRLDADLRKQKTVSSALNKALDAVGLRDCGSNQT